MNDHLRCVTIVGLIASLAAFAGCRGTNVQRVADVLTGSFASVAQAEADPENYLDIRLHAAPIWTHRRDGPWLYVEQASISALDRPYRQRVYRIEDLGGGTVRSHVYTMPDPLDCAGWWRTPDYFDDALAPSDLDLREGCSITLDPELEATDDGAAMTVWVGGTAGTGCSSDLRGATYASSDVRLYPDYLLTWDRGFDATGEQVWGAEAGPYRFDRIDADHVRQSSRGASPAFWYTTAVPRTRQ